MSMKVNYAKKLIDGVLNIGTNPIEGIFAGAYDFDNFGFHLVTADNPRTVVVTGTDNVVASTHTWTFANAAFTAADVGGTLTISGSAHNDGTYTIASRTSGTIVVTGGTQTNETFSSAVTLVVTPPSLTGAWTLKGSNNYVLNGLNQIATAGSWPDITSLFNATPTAVTAASDQYRQIVEYGGRGLKIVFTPTGGVGRVTAYIHAKAI